MALPDDPFDVAVGAVVDCAADWAPLDVLPDTKPGVTLPEDDPLAVTEVDDDVVVELAGVVAPAVVVLVLTLTTPFCMTAPGVAEVCAAAGDATATEISTA